MPSSSDQLAELAGLSAPALRAEWRRVYRSTAPKLSPDLLVRGIAYRLQEKRYGGVASAVERMLSRVAVGSAQVLRQQAVSLRPGTQLVRGWHGETHRVLVTDDGYIWNGELHGSLSRIAQAITGTKWSGPRFFGLNGNAAPVVAKGSAHGQA